MTPFLAMSIASGEMTPANNEERVDAWQCLIDNGSVWTLPGSYGRIAARMIDEGVCWS